MVKQTNPKQKEQEQDEKKTREEVRFVMIDNAHDTKTFIK